MLIGNVVFNPQNIRRYQVNYPWLASSETISSCSATVLPNDGLFSVDNLVVSPDGKSLLYFATGQGGAVTGDTYTVTISVTTSDGQVNYDEVSYFMDPRGRG